MDGIKVDVTVTVAGSQQSRVIARLSQGADPDPREDRIPQPRQTIRYGVPQSSDGHL